MQHGIAIRFRLECGVVHLGPPRFMASALGYRAKWGAVPNLHEPCV